MKRDWKKHLFYASLLVLGVGFVWILFETFRLKNTGFETKTLWDWMELLLIPLFLAGGAFYLERSERAVERRIAKERIEEERKRAEDRAELEREIALDRQREAALQTYFDRMTELLLKEKLRTTENKEVRDVARTRTTSVILTLDSNRINLVVRFLREAHLILEKNSIFADANLATLNLRLLDLSKVNFQNANLGKANLQKSYLTAANLAHAYLGDANLQDAFLEGANLQSANLIDANLQDAYLSDANLQDAYLIGANLQGAYLGRTNLKGAQITEAQLAAVKFIMGATMPDGTIRE